MAIERLGAFLDGRDYGEPTALPWGVLMWGETRHPVQIYEMASLLVMLGLLLWWRGRRSYPGQSFSLFVTWYAASRLFLEAFRADAPLISGGLRSAQVVALMVLLATLWYLYRRHFAARRESASAEAPETL
jgi:phosphatidylglycerol:prolipoprotein diacylglycerol transferase